MQPAPIWSKGPLLYLLFSGLFLSCGQAEIRLPPIISDHAILQKSNHTSIWGWARPDEKIMVSLDKISSTTQADVMGKWHLSLDLSACGSGPFVLIVEGENRLTVSDVLIGELWLASGQSNMQFTLNATEGGEKEIQGSANPSLRWFVAKSKAGFMEPQETVTGQWFIADPLTSGDCSGVAYYFGQKLQGDLKIPLGLILTAQGGSTIQSWMSEDALKQVPELQKERDRLLARAYGKKVKPPLTPMFYYNQLIHPLARMTLKGFIWYQGEAHYNQGALYAQAFPALIRDWRKAFQQQDLPFYFCQLPNTDAKTWDPGNEGWIAGVREAQDETLREPMTGQVVLIDAGGVDTHPRNKKVVGQRLALLAEEQVYGQKVAAQSPRYISATVESPRVKVRFSHSEGGLLAASLPDPDLGGLPKSQVQGFALCGKDQKWFWAQAEIHGDSVEVWSPQTPEPAGLRYAWSNNPTCNLYNQAKLPAAPFRVDLSLPTKAESSP